MFVYIELQEGFAAMPDINSRLVISAGCYHKLLTGNPFAFLHRLWSMNLEYRCHALAEIFITETPNLNEAILRATYENILVSGMPIKTVHRV